MVVDNNNSKREWTDQTNAVDEVIDTQLLRTKRTDAVFTRVAVLDYITEYLQYHYSTGLHYT